MPGKLQPEILRKSVLSYTGTKRDDLLVGGGLGEDAALIKVNGTDSILVAASDPVVGAEKNAGKLLVHINANDVACKGADPAWLIVTLIVPEAGGTVLIEKIMRDIHSTCLKMNIAIAGGHTELTDRYSQPVISGTMLGLTKYELGIDKIKPGDLILATGHAGLEGMSIIASDRPDLLAKVFAPNEVNMIRAWYDDLSILPAARILREYSCYMHDPTEGGLGGALSEICTACGHDIEFYHDAVPVSDLTRRAADALNFDPMNLISSGMLVAAVSPDKATDAQNALKAQGISSSIIGKFLDKNKNKKNFLNTREELWGILARK